MKRFWYTSRTPTQHGRASGRRAKKRWSDSSLQVEDPKASATPTSLPTTCATFLGSATIVVAHSTWRMDLSHKGARRLRSAPAPRAPVHTDSAAQSVTLRGRQRRHRSARNQLMRKPLREAKASARGTPGALYRPPDVRDPLAAQSTLLILRTAEFPHRKTERPPFGEHPPEPRPNPDTDHRPHNHSRSPTQKPSHPTLPRVSNRPK